MIRYPPKPMRGWPGTELHKRLINDPEWIVEPKKNGERCIVHLNGTITLWTRKCKPISANPELVEALQSFLSDSGVTMLDGELIKKELLWMFDIPNLPYTLRDRRDELAGLHKGGCDVVKLMPWPKKDGAYEACIAAGDEGVVFKHAESAYQPQLEPDNEVPWWIKIKPPEKW